MVLEIKHKFEFPHRKDIWVLISERYEDNFISPHLVVRLSRLLETRSSCFYEVDHFVIRFQQDRYYDSFDCKVVSLEGIRVVLGNSWLKERRATFNEEINSLRVRIHGQWTRQWIKKSGSDTVNPDPIHCGSTGP